jgi:hypothetical protein
VCNSSHLGEQSVYFSPVPVHVWGPRFSEYLPLHVFITLLIAPWVVLWYPARIDDSTPPESLPCSVHTFVRPLDRFPPNFESRAKASSKGFISPVRNEQSLLNCLLGTPRTLPIPVHRLITTVSSPPPPHVHPTFVVS